MFLEKFKFYKMKRILFVLIFVTMALASNAQFFVAGSVSATYYSNSTTYEFGIIGNPTINSGFSCFIKNEGKGHFQINKSL